MEDHAEKFQSLRSESFNFNTNYAEILDWSQEEDHAEKFQSLRSESFNFNTNYRLIRPAASCFRVYCAR
jgi:hypothetical protein